MMNITKKKHGELLNQPLKNDKQWWLLPGCAIYIFSSVVVIVVEVVAMANLYLLFRLSYGLYMWHTNHQTNRKTCTTPNNETKSYNGPIIIFLRISEVEFAVLYFEQHPPAMISRYLHHPWSKCWISFGITFQGLAADSVIVPLGSPQAITHYGHLAANTTRRRPKKFQIYHWTITNRQILMKVRSHK